MKAILTSSLGGQIKVDGKRIPTYPKKGPKKFFSGY